MNIYTSAVAVAASLIIACGVSAGPTAEDLIRRFEGMSVNSYIDAGGETTVCYGHTGAFTDVDHDLDRQTCEALLREDIRQARKCVAEAVGWNKNSGGAQEEALVSFVYNVGCHAFKESTLLEHHRANRCDEVADEFGRWVHAGGEELPGLVRRRRAESQLYESECE